MATRHERVVLDLEDRFTGEMARAAAATALLKRELNDLSGTAVRTRSSVDPTTNSITKSGTESDRAASSIDRYSGRLGLLVDVAASLGPALVPIGAVAIPAVAGLTQQFGFAALAGGTLLASAQGVGNAVKALEKARLEPTKENLEAAQLAMEKLGPDAQRFAKQVQDFLPVLRQVRDAGAAGWFPGLTKSLDDLEQLGPKVADIFQAIGKAGGDLVAEGAASLNSERWQPFFDFIEREAPKALIDLGHAVGDVTHGLAEMWMAFSPLNTDFSKWMVDAANSFDQWATGLSQTQGFQEFVDYIRTNGPLVADALGSIGNALLQIVEAAAPLGGPTLRIIASVADAVAKLADSDLGTPLIALASLSSTMRLLGRATDSLSPKFTKAGASARTFGADLKAASSFGYLTRTEMERSSAATGRLSDQFKSFGKNAAIIGGVTLAASGLSDKFGLTNTTTLALAGSMAGPLGAAFGGAIGLAMDLGDRFDGINSSMTDYKTIIEQVNGVTLDQARAGQVNTDQLIKQAQAALLVARALGDGDGASAARAALDHARAIDQTVKAEQSLHSQQQGTYRLYQLETQAIQENIAAMRDRRAEALRGLNAELDYKGSILDARDALAKNGKTVNENTRAGQENLRTLYALASSWNAQDDATKNAAGSLQKARANFIKTAEAMGMGEDKAKRLARALFEIPTDRTTRINVESDVAAAKIRGLKSQLDSIDRDLFINIHARTPNLGGLGPQIYNGSADGGTVPKTGRPYADRHHYLLADGEEVISNRYGQADRNRALLKAINAGQLANGGTAGRYYSSRTNQGERVVEYRLPKGRFVAHIEGVGEAMMSFVSDVADDRINAHQAQR